MGFMSDSTATSSAATSSLTQDAAPDRFVGPRDVTHWATPLGRGLAEVHHRAASRVGARPAFIVSLVIGGAVAVAAAAAATSVYDGVAGSNGIEALDRPILKRAQRLRSPGLNFAAASIARVFGPIGMPLAAVAASLALSLPRRTLIPAVVVGAAGAGSLLMTIAGKDIIHRHRPDRHEAIPPYETSPSFPSGHTLNATTVVGAVAYLLVLRQQANAAQAATITGGVATAAAVGLSRVLLGAHWFSDVVMGWMTGTGWLAIIITSHRLYLSSAARPDVEDEPGVDS
jgi:membrane-associated phospholipid phosphatase